MTAAEQAAERIGTGAGQRFRDSGTPSRNPFDGKGRPKLAAAWRRGYLAAATPRKRR